MLKKGDPLFRVRKINHSKLQNFIIVSLQYKGTKRLTFNKPKSYDIILKVILSNTKSKYFAATLKSDLVKAMVLI